MLRPIYQSEYFDNRGAIKCPECGDYLEYTGFRRELVNFKEIVESPLLCCRNCRRIFEEVESESHT